VRNNEKERRGLVTVNKAKKKGNTKQ